MTEQESPATQDVSTVSKERLLAVLAFLALAVALGYFYIKSQSAAKDAADTTTALQKELENYKAELADLKKAELRRLETESVNASVIDEHLSDLDDMDTRLSDLDEQFTRWEKTLSQVHTTDLGARIGSDERTLREYQALQADKAPKRDMVAKLRSRIELLREPLEKAAESELQAYRPSAEFAERLLSITQDIDEAMETMRALNARFEALVALAPAEAPPDAPRLTEALFRLEQGWAVKQNEELTKQLDSLREEFAAKLQEERLKTEGLRQQFEIKREKREREIEEVRNRDELSSLEAYKKQLAEEKARLAAEAQLERDYQRDLPEIDLLLRPFVTNGRTQPGKEAFEISVDVGPVSYSKLKSAGVLERTVDAQRRLWRMTTANRTNDRDLGAFPSYFGSQQDWAQKQPTVARAQELLIKYGELMVNRGKLAP